MVLTLKLYFASVFFFFLLKPPLMQQTSNLSIFIVKLMVLGLIITPHWMEKLKQCGFCPVSVCVSLNVVSHDIAQDCACYFQGFEQNNTTYLFILPLPYSF